MSSYFYFFFYFFFFFNDTATTEIYTLSLHDALPIWRRIAADAVDAIEPAEQDRLGVAGIGETVVGPRQILLRNRAHHIRRHQHHQLGLLIDIVAALEQRSENGKLGQARQAVDRLLGLILDHAGHRQRAAGRNLHRRFGAPGADRRDGRGGVAAGFGDGQRVLRRQIRYLGHHLEADAALAQHDRREIETDAEFLEVDRRLTGRHGAAGARGRAAIAVENRKFAAGDESRGFSGNRRQVRLRQRMDNAGLLHGL